MSSAVRCSVAVAVAIAWPLMAQAQTSKSAPLAKELAAALQAANIQSLATADPANPGVYVGVLHIPGGQLLAVACKASSPASVDYKVKTKAYLDVYMDLSADRTGADKIFVEDMGANGIQAERHDEEPFDTIELNGKKIALDSDPGKQKLSDEEYRKAFATADERYSQLLTALLAELKKAS